MLFFVSQKCYNLKENTFWLATLSCGVSNLVNTHELHCGKSRDYIIITAATAKMIKAFRFTMSCVSHASLFFFAFHGLRWEVAVHFVDIDEIVDHHFLNFLFIIEHKFVIFSIDGEIGLAAIWSFETTGSERKHWYNMSLLDFCYKHVIELKHILYNWDYQSTRSSWLRWHQVL